MNEVRRLLLNKDRQLPPADRDAILALGQDAVPTLIEVLADRTMQASEDDAESMAAIHAADILGHLKAVAAIPALLRELLWMEPGYILFDAALFALEEMGTACVEPALALLADATAREQASLASVLSQADTHDPRILALLLVQLDRDVMAGAMNLGRYGDPAALPDLLRAFDATPLSARRAMFADQALIELQASIVDMGGVLNAAQQAKFRDACSPNDAFRKQMLDALSSLSQNPQAQNPLPRPAQPPNQPKQLPIYARDRPGRNDPCWCGSGKKYKKCHLWDDEQ